MKVQVEIPGGQKVHKEKEEVQPLIDAGYIEVKEGRVSVYEMTNAGRREYIIRDILEGL